MFQKLILLKDYSEEPMKEKLKNLKKIFLTKMRLHLFRFIIALIKKIKKNFLCYAI